MIANQNIQDQALENFKAEQTEITVFFLNTNMRSALSLWIQNLLIQKLQVKVKNKL